MTDIISGGLPGIHVRLTVALDCGHVLSYTDTIEDKYPFYCEECDLDHRSGKYPWTLKAEVVSVDGVPVEGLSDLIRAVRREGIRYGEMDEAARTAYREENGRLLAEFEAIPETPAVNLPAAGFTPQVSVGPCRCLHAAGSHWEVSEPGGPRKGCGVLGCGCGAYAG